MNEEPMDRAKGAGLREGDGHGWGGGKWWQENGDNCIRTSIKKEKNYFPYFLCG